MKKNLYTTTNSETNRILNLHKTATKNQYLNENVSVGNLQIYDDVIIRDWLSPDEKYVIFLDELYDLKEKKQLGNIWENASNLLTFLSHTYQTSNLDPTIKEYAANTFGKMLITESKKDLTLFKSQIKEMLLDESILGDVWQGAKDWGSEVIDKTKKGLTDFGKDVWSGTKKFGSAILSGDWKKVWELMKKGTLYLARKIRQAVYSEVGIIIDTILIVSGVGKVAQFVVWAIVVALDIYEYSTGNYEHPDEPDWMRALFFGIDVLGMVTAGSAAIAARRAAKAATVGLRTTEEVGAKIAKSPNLQNTIETVSTNLSGGGTKMEQAGRRLGSGKLGNWFRGALSKMGGFFKYIGETLAKLLSFKTIKAAAKTTAVVGGLGVGSKLYNKYSGNNEPSLSSGDIKTLTSGDADYSDYI